MRARREERITDQGLASLEATVRRSRGGQPGNTNALKHGRYTAAALAQRRAVARLLRDSASVRAQSVRAMRTRLPFDRDFDDDKR